MLTVVRFIQKIDQRILVGDHQILVEYYIIDNKLQETQAQVDVWLPSILIGTFNDEALNSIVTFFYRPTSR
jgi:hypothetical protein